jgi:poly(hydroxyalkanoate) depolymerase family esterase
MKLNLTPDLLAATRLIKAGRLGDATEQIQRALGTAGGELPKALHDLLEQARSGVRSLGEGLGLREAPARAPDGQFLARTYSNAAGARPYRLYVPTGYRGGAKVPLVVMLHGCNQSPDDFAAGTRMNDAGETHTMLVAYPGQTSGANMQKCWNWFSPGDQRRDRGEPSLIAGITREIMRDYAIDPRRVYVAGLSAGGAAASVLGATYSDLYAAVGVHSGLPCGAAHDVGSAFAAMQHGSDPATAAAACDARDPMPPAIIFHGDQDGTVNPRNADAVVSQITRGASLGARREKGQVPGGHGYTRRVYVDANGRTVAEQWIVHGGNHAWSGGSPSGSYTDPAGPDATREMVRFFLANPR